MIHLLDVNVLIALCDPAHPHAEVASRYFAAGPLRDGWATCPLTENGFLRILGSERYPGGPGSPTAARTILASLVASPGHQFWTDSVSLLDPRIFSQLESPAQLTDLYLLGLAVAKSGRFATFDHRIDPRSIPGGPQAYLPLPLDPRGTR